MFKTKKVDEFGGQTGNEEQSEDVVITEEKIIGDDGVERTITKKTTTRRIVQTQHVTQGAKVTTTKRSVFNSDGKELPEEFQKFSIENEKKKEIKGKTRSGSSSSSSSEDEGIKQKIKSFLKGSKSSKEQKKEPIAIKGVPQKSNSSHSGDEPSSKPTDDVKEFAEECLKWHNHYREKHGVKPLKLSSKLNDYAKEWVIQIAKKDVMEHRPNNTNGENIFMKWSTNPNFKIAGRDPVENWYAEIKDHIFGKEPTSLKSGHFTQVVWRASEELGVAKARTSTGKIICVANYYPAGNMIGEFTANVPKPK